MRRLALLLLFLFALPLRAGSYKADDGVQLHYEVIGRGRPVVLLSGGPGFAPGYMRALADGLTGDFSFVLFHQRGTGLSAMETVNTETHALTKLVADLDGLRRELKQEKLVIVAHSWGGILAMMYAAGHPDRVGALALVNSGGPTLQAVPKFASNLDARLTGEERAAVKLWSSPEKVAENRKRAVLELTRARTPGYFADRKKAHLFLDGLDEGSLNDAVFWSIIVQIPFNFDLRPSLNAFDAPVLVIHGRQDPLESGAEVHEAFAGSRMVWVDDAGHFPWLEQPKKVRKALGEFLREAGRETRK